MMKGILIFLCVLLSNIVLAQESNEKAETILDASNQMKIGTASIMSGLAFATAGGGTALLINGLADNVDPVVPAVIGGVSVAMGMAGISFGTIQVVKGGNKLTNLQSRHSSRVNLSFYTAGSSAGLLVRF